MTHPDRRPHPAPGVSEPSADEITVP